MFDFQNRKYVALMIFMVLIGGTVANSQSIQSAFAASGNSTKLGYQSPPSLKTPILSKQQVQASTFSSDDVFAAVGLGMVKRFSPAGTLLQTLDTTTNSAQTAGMCFDSGGNLYVTDFQSNIVSKFDNAGILSAASWASALDTHPESCVIDKSSHVYVGDADGTALIYKFDLAGNQLDSFSIAPEKRGTDWIDLAADQCTIHYTSEGNTIKAFNVCTKTQLPDFASGLSGPCYAHRITSDGGEMVACAQNVYKLDNTGAVTKTYPNPNPSDFLFALNLDPDGTTFWTAGYNSGNIYRINIATGAIGTTFNDAHFTKTSGLAVFGERTVSNPTTPGPVGGMGIPIDTTALLLAGVQGSVIWMIPAIVVAGAGMGIFSFRKSKKKHN